MFLLSPHRLIPWNKGPSPLGRMLKSLISPNLDPRWVPGTEGLVAGAYNGRETQLLPQEDFSTRS